MIDTADDVYVIGWNSSTFSKVMDLWPWSLTGRAIKVQCGYDSAFILTTTGLYMIKFDSCDECGAVTDPIAPRRTRLQNVVDISMTRRHILALTTSGGVFAWGDNDWGECGIDSDGHPLDQPTRVKGIEAYEVHQISAGSDYSLLRCSLKSQ